MDSEQLSEVRGAYERWARSYDETPNATRDLDGALLRSTFQGEHLGDVLEPGCGTGKNTRWLTKRGRVTGLDFSAEMLRRCRGVAPHATLHEVDLNEPWPVADASMDWVIISLVLEHIEKLAPIARECARVLRANGQVRLTELHPARQLLGKGARFQDQGRWVRPPTYTHTAEEYLAAFGEAGFSADDAREARAPSDALDKPPRLLTLTLSVSDATHRGR